MHCDKQRGGWAPFSDFSFQVKSLALDEHADRTGPVIEACEAPTEAPPRPSRQVQAVYDVYLELYERYKPAGVYYSTWKSTCLERGIPESSFKYGRSQLLDKFNLVYQPDTNGAYYPVGASAQAGPMGQEQANCPDAGSCPEQANGWANGTTTLRELVPLASQPSGIPDRACLRCGMRCWVEVDGTWKSGCASASEANI